MREFWDGAARTNAAWYVDTTLDFDNPDMQQFFDDGRRIASEALAGPVTPDGHGLAVEIGSGLGRVCLGLAERFDRVIGVDIAPEMVRRARALVPNERVSFVFGDGATLRGIEDASADLVVSFTVFQHIPAESVIEAYIREAGRVLRPGGVASFQWNNEPGARAWRLKRTALSWMQRVGVRREPHRRNAAEFLGSKVPMGRMHEMLRDAGLEPAGAKQAGTLFAWIWARRA